MGLLLGILIGVFHKEIISYGKFLYGEYKKGVENSKAKKEVEELTESI